jgi:hypothetical protein
MNKKKKFDLFVPEMANLQTWINQRRWELELEKIENGSSKTNSGKANFSDEELMQSIARGYARGQAEREQRLKEQ